jgi:hypothetical protein
MSGSSGILSETWRSSTQSLVKEFTRDLNVRGCEILFSEPVRSTQRHLRERGGQIAQVGIFETQSAGSLE